MRYVSIAIIVSLIVATSCSRTQVPTPEVNVVQVKEISLDPNDSAWDPVSLHVSKLILQDLVEPRLMEPSTQEVNVKAMTDGSEIAFRLEWVDETQSDLPGPRHFIDGCAVQLPSKIEANVPAPQMGEVGKTVEISYWRADWQATVDGRADDIKALYPNATVDHYPSESKPLENDPKAQAETAARYAPARSLGNRRSGPRTQPVEDLIAEGPGTLSPAPNAISKGKGVKTAKGWAVVITRPMPAGFSNAMPSQIAFAVWEGAHTEVGARKMRTGWVPLILKSLGKPL
ncbi:MAG: ethylbenzene dehydrogenase-related protein [Pyrinomonadaceae bacterium]